MDRKQAEAKVKSLLARIDRVEETVDKIVMSIATGIADKPWTARVVLAVMLILTAYTLVLVL